MKKTMIIGLAIGLAMTATSALAAGPVPGGSGIVGSYHDLGVDYADSQSRICVFCHHPHNSIKQNTNGVGDYSPLWNHTMSAATFTTYDNGMIGKISDSSNTLNAVQGGPGGVSLLCLSCHDGTVAINAYSLTDGKPNPGANDSALGAGTRATIGDGGDMSNHHPIGFNYADVAAADTEIARIEKPMTGGGVTIGGLLYNGNMECTTCHDVHNSQNDAGAEKFLWTTNDASAFCLVCHEKAGTKF